MAEKRLSEAVPRFATERNPQRETIGPKVARVSTKLGEPFIPWQQLASDIAGELDPETGDLWYRKVVLIVQRQAGKTTKLRARQTYRCLFTPRALVRYTAQTRLAAQARLEHDFWQPINDSPLNVFLDAKAGRRSGKPGYNGSTGEEEIVFANQSRWQVETVKSTAGHGPTIDDGFIDEAFAHKDGAIEAAMVPAMNNRSSAQLWVASAAGTFESTYLNANIDAGRALVAVENAKPMHERRSRTAYIEYSAPEDADREDIETVWQYHPGMGWLTTEAAVLGAKESFELNGEPEEYDRAYLGWRVQRKAPEAVIPKLRWVACGIDPEAEGVEWTSEPMWSVDVDPDREHASVCLAAGTPGARAWVECVASEPGVAWSVEYLRTLRGQFGGNRVAIDGSGPASALEPDLVEAGFEVIRLSAREKADACGAIYDDAVSGILRHGNDPVLDRSMTSAVKRHIGDSYVWARARSAGDITAWYGVTIARYALLQILAEDYDVMDSIG